MRDFSTVSYAIGWVLVVVGGLAFLPVLSELLNAHLGVWEPFLLGATLTTAIGVSLIIATYNHRDKKLTTQQALLLMISIWIVIPIFGSLPFLLQDNPLSYVDAIFESMSGFTTTGSTILQDVDGQSHGILLWRGLLQWMGGIGVILAAMAFLPRLGVGGMQLFSSAIRVEERSLMVHEMTLFKRIVGIYLGLTVLCMLAYWFFGMSLFDAFVHSMTTIATGGFGNYNSSFSDFGASIEYTSVVFMILASFPYICYAQMVSGRLMPVFQDSQIRAFLVILVAIITTLTTWIYFFSSGSNFEMIFRKTLFNGVSIMTGTGYASANYAAWGGFAVTLFFLIGLIGGCAGSSTCSIKVFRFQVLASSLITEIQRIRSPQTVLIPRYQGRPISQDIISSVTGFLFLFVATLGILTVLLGLTGLDLTTAASGAAASLANIGPGLGDTIGPSGNFSSLPNSSKWILITGMLLGRLEILSVLALFQPTLWRR